MTPLGKATCRTCGATGPPWHHQPSPLDPAGIGDPGHAMKDKQDADLDEIIKDLVTGAISWNNYGNTESIGYEERAKQALDQYITDRIIEELETIKKKATEHCAFKIDQYGSELDVEDVRLAVPVKKIVSRISELRGKSNE